MNKLITELEKTGKTLQDNGALIHLSYNKDNGDLVHSLVGDWEILSTILSVRTEGFLTDKQYETIDEMSKFVLNVAINICKENKVRREVFLKALTELK